MSNKYFKHNWLIYLLSFIFILCACFLISCKKDDKKESTSADNDNKKQVTEADNKQKKSELSTVDFSVKLLQNGFLITFTESMVDAKSLNISLNPDALPLTFSPELSGEGKWENEKTLVFNLYTAIPKATNITIVGRENLKNLKGKSIKETLTFLPYPFKFIGAEQIYYKTDGTVGLKLNFNAEVAAANLQSQLKIIDEQKKDYPFTVEQPFFDKPNKHIVISLKNSELLPLTLTLPKGFVSEEGDVGLSVESKYNLSPSSVLAINSINPQQSYSTPWTRFIDIYANNQIDLTNLKTFVELSPDMPFTISSLYNGFRIEGDFLNSQTVKVTLKKGLVGSNGVLTEDYVQHVVFRDFYPKVSLYSPGRILSSKRAELVPFESINVDRIHTMLWRLPDNNIPLLALELDSYFQKELSLKVTMRSAEIKGKRNEASKKSIDIKELAGNNKGVFLLSLKDASNTDAELYQDLSDTDWGDFFYYPSEDEKLIVISDIGIAAHLLPQSITVWLNSIALATPIENAKIQVFSKKNTLLAQGNSDSNGLWHYNNGQDWDNQLNPAIIVVSVPTDNDPAKINSTASVPTGKDKVKSAPTDINYLILNGNMSYSSTFDTTGSRQYLRKGYEVFSFSNRGLFRPGESVSIVNIVKDKNNAPPEPFPLGWSLNSASGRTIASGTTLLNKSGSSTVTIPLSEGIATGAYSFYTFIPGQEKNILGKTFFNVEDFVPPKVSVDFNFMPTALLPKQSTTINIESKYLFGAVNAEAIWEASLRSTAENFSHPKWRAFVFGNPEINFTPSEDEYLNEGSLDTNGQGNFTFTPNTEIQAPCLINNLITVKVQEDSGRFAGKTKILTYYPMPILFGLEYAGTEANVNSQYQLNIVALDSKSIAENINENSFISDIKQAKIKVERIVTNYARSTQGIADADELILVQEQDLYFEQGLAKFSFTPETSGTFLITVQDNNSNSSASVRINAWGGLITNDTGSSLIDKVFLSFDKPKYKIGDIAKITAKLPFAGDFLLLIANDQEIYRQSLKTNQTEIELSVPITQNMLPNVYCTAWLVRPVPENGHWLAHRAFGIAPLSIDQSEQKLKINIDSQTKILPLTDFKVNLQLLNNKNQPVQGEVSLALVDEALLNLTLFETPNPYEFFTAKRYILGQTFDIYNQLIPFTDNEKIKLRSPLIVGGGAAEDLSFLSPIKRNQELLSIFMTNLKTDANGKLSVTLPIPEFSGTARLMAVAVADSNNLKFNGATGSAQENILIARPITIDFVTPLAVAPNDEFVVPVTILATDFEQNKNNLNYKVTLNISNLGPIKIEQPENTYVFYLNQAEPKKNFELKLKAENEINSASLNIQTTLENLDANAAISFEQKQEIAIRPAYPRITNSGSGTASDQNPAEIIFTGTFLPGSEQSILNLGDSPSVDLLTALQYLSAYPYGCLEQTVSAAWAYLAVPEMLKELNPEIANDNQYKQKLNVSISKILSMQRNDGSFSAWTNNPESFYPWGSVYATHFLLAANKSPLATVPSNTLKAALLWLRSFLATPVAIDKEQAKLEMTAKAYACYVLALENDSPLGWMQYLNDQKANLEPSGIIFLAGAYALASGSESSLINLGVTADNQVFSNNRNINPNSQSLESSARNQALQLLMWTDVSPLSAEAAKLAKQVINSGKQNEWTNTQENAFAALALGRYMEKTAEARKPFTATLLAENEIANFRQGQSLTLFRNDIPNPPPQALQNLKLTVQGEGIAYYAWQNTGIPLTAPNPESNGIFINKIWQIEENEPIDFANNNQNIIVKQGSVIFVTLKIDPELPLSNLVISDLLAGGLEIENPNLIPVQKNNESQDYQNYQDQYQDQNQYDEQNNNIIDPALSKQSNVLGTELVNLNGSDKVRIEMREDRLLLFLSELTNPAEFKFSLRAVTKGKFIVPPLGAEAMYNPSIKAITKPCYLVVE